MREGTLHCRRLPSDAGGEAVPYQKHCSDTDGAAAGAEADGDDDEDDEDDEDA